MCNIGKTDRIFRLVLGIALLTMTFIGPQTPWGWIGLIPLVTSVLCFCPVYSVIGFRSGDDDGTA